MKNEATDPLAVIGEKHMLSIIAFIADYGPCSKTDIYSAISRGTRMLDKLEILADAGLIEISTVANHHSMVEITDKGRDVAMNISEIRRIMGTGIE